MQSKGVDYIVSVTHTQLPRTIGNKASNLQFLIKKGFQAPVTHVCTWDAYLRYLQDDVAKITSHTLLRVNSRASSTCAAWMASSRLSGLSGR